MARTIAEIQEEILREKDKIQEFNALTVLTTNEKKDLASSLTSTSKASIWRLWVYIVSTAIWLHEKVVERNALISRPHTLAWYREQALDYIQGAMLVWEDGYFRFDLSEISDAELEAKKIIKYCSISERLFSDVFQNDESSPDNGEGSPATQDVASLIQEYYYNQVGILTMKVAAEENGSPRPLGVGEKITFQNYMNQIKDAGTQIRIVSTTGDKIRIELEVYVNPLAIYTDGENKGKLVRDLSRKPVEEIIINYLENLEFNGAFVPTFLIDRVQQVEGVELPILRKINIAPSGSNLIDNKFVVYSDEDSKRESPFFVPTSGYFDAAFALENKDIVIDYLPYNLQTDPSFNVQFNNN